MASPAEATPTSRFERRRLRSRTALIDAAITLFQERGLRATKLEDICLRADVAPRTFFNHFATREELYEAIARQRAEQTADRIDALIGDQRPFARRLHDLFVMIGAYLDARPPYRELVGEMLRLRHGSNEFVRSGVLGAAAMRFVRDAIKRREIGRRHRPEVLVDLLLGALIVGLGNWSAGEEPNLERTLGEAARALAELFTAGGR
jgi:AcrR family transcriptional regulator